VKTLKVYDRGAQTFHKHAGRISVGLWQEFMKRPSFVAGMGIGTRPGSSFLHITSYRCRGQMRDIEAIPINTHRNTS
jgi:hypothetical protein